MKENINKYLPLVKSIARQFNYPYISFDDLVHEGLLEVFEAQQRFDDSKGVMFSTYATYWIKKRIMEYIKNERKHFLKGCLWRR